MNTCRNCNTWVPLDIDDRCSWCGRQLSFEARMEPEIVYPSGLARVELHITNYTPQPLRVNFIECSIPQLSPAGDRWSNTTVHEKLTLDWNLDLQGIDRSKEIAVDVTVQVVQAGVPENSTDCTYEERTRFVLSPTPVLKLMEPQTLDVMCDLLGGSEQHIIRIGIEQGSIQIHEVKLVPDMPWMKIESWPEPQFLAAGLPDTTQKQLPVSIRIDKAEMLKALGDSASSEYSFRLQVSHGHAWPEDEIGPLKVRLQYPPRLKVREASVSEPGGAETWTLKEQRVYWDKGEYPRITTIPIEFENVGGAGLPIKEIKLSKPCSWIQLSASSLTVGPRESPDQPGAGAIVLTLNGNQARKERAEVLKIDATVHTHDGKLRPTAILIPLSLVELQPASIPVAIDFGTSFTTCAYFSQGRTESVIFESGETSIETAIFYEDLDNNGEPIIKIGKEALGSTHLSPASLVTEIKRRLGSKKKIQVSFEKNRNLAKEYTAAEIAGHFLRAFRARVESRLGMIIRQCVVSHPVFFLDCSVKALKEAFERGGFEPVGFSENGLGTELLVEPVAAAFNFIQADAEQTQQDKNYRIAVFDFGGGTTDFTSIKVSYKYDRRMTITTTIEDVDGERFGGYDITLKLAYYVIDKWIESIKAPNEVRRLIPLTLEEISSLPDKISREHALHNRREVLDAAEKIKQLFASEIRVDGTVSLRGISYGHLTYGFHYSDFDNLIKADIASLIGSFKEMIGAEKEKQPDTIVVCGNSSRLSLVLPMIEAAFPNIGIKPLAETPAAKEPRKDRRFPSHAPLKECIVNGLLQYRMMHIRPLAIRLDTEKSYLGIPNKLIMTLGVGSISPSLGEYFAEVANKNLTLPTEPIAVDDGITRDTEIQLLAMGGRSDRIPLYIDKNGRLLWNSRIQPLGVVKGSQFNYPNEVLRKCRLLIQIGKDRSVNVMVDGDIKGEVKLEPEMILD